MKKSIVFIVGIVLTISLFAQAPESFSYQAIVRDNLGQPLPNTPVTFQFNILQTSASGTTVYSENQTTMTNDFGLVNLQIGQGTVQSGTFSAIDWSSDAYFLNIQMDLGSGFVDLGTQQFVSVPYALYSKSSGSSGNTNATGNTGDIQYNDNGNLGADPDFHWDMGEKKLVIGQDTSDGRLIIQQDPSMPDSIPILEVKNKVGQTIFVVYPDSVHIFIDDSSVKGALKGGFVVSGRSSTQTVTNDFLLVRPDSTRISFNKSGAKGVLKGGFAVSGRSGTKAGVEEEYFNISPNDTASTINPSEARIMWYPVKEAFLSGRVLIESPDSVGMNSWATGFESKAIGNFSQAMGYKVVSKGIISTAIGYMSKAEGVNSYAFGANVLALDSNAYAFGKSSAALAKGSFVFGESDTSSAISAMALGYKNKAEGVASLALGAYTHANDTLSISMGYNTLSSGISSLAMGDNTQALGNSSLALGSGTIASAEASTSMGFETVASGKASIAMGHKSMATNLHAIAMGDSTLASGHDATAMGYRTTANGFFSTSMGYLTTAQGLSSFASGSESTANGEASIAMGYNTDANGYASMAIGISTNASGDASVAIGNSTFAQGDASVAYGISTNATTAGSFVVGSYNEAFASVNSTDPNSDIFVVANGIVGIPHNAVTVLKMGNVGINTNTPDKLLTVNGDARVTGDLYYGIIGAPTTYNKPDFVFQPNYNKNFDIASIEKFIKKHKHLPWVTAAKDEKDGVNMTRMSFQTLEAVENQQLQIIELKKENLKQQAKINNLKKEKDQQINGLKKEYGQKINELLKRIEKLEKLNK